MKPGLLARCTLVLAAWLAVALAALLGAQALWPAQAGQNQGWLNQGWCRALLVWLAMLPLLWLALRSQLQPALALFRALTGTVISFQDGDYSVGLHWPRNDELGQLVSAHNNLGEVLRSQRLDLIQRELLLDTMLHNTPVAMLLVADAGPVVFANQAARQLLNQGRKLEGQTLAQVLQQVAPALREALARTGDGLFGVPPAAGSASPDNVDAEQIYHLSRRSFSLNGRRHELLMLRHLTLELRRQEVQTWKKVIRVISHELNNSLAPVASLAHSGAELVRRSQYERLPQILATIEERTRHLESFIHGYARFAKLPAPHPESTPWPAFLAHLQAQTGFVVQGELPPEPGYFDRAQLEQALLNLLKNAHEAGSAADQVALSVRRAPDAFRIDVQDSGSGMSETVMANALVPFYSTKRSGTGLGLALAREIIEAHGGHIMLANRTSGGLQVSLILPLA
jgi:nitrogen fixation/metabolism regulation signal transduction histidine kinase